MSLLSAIFCLPLLAAVLLLFIPRSYRFVFRLIALGTTFVSMLLAFVLFLRFDSAAVVDGFRFVYEKPWVSVDALHLLINYHVGVDGINLGLIVMGAVVAFAATCCSWEIKGHDKEYYVLLLVMIGGILGAFASLDLFFLYFFHELALVPTFIMIGIWGRGERKNYATFQITMYLSVGALLALFGLIALYVQSGVQSFDIVTLTKHIGGTATSIAHPIALPAQQIIFPLLLFGFGILVSLWPFHTWAPLGYGCAPTATAMLHAGVLKKFGLYALLRVALPLLPVASQQWMSIVAFLCLGNLLYCGLVAIRQKDLNLLIGNSSVAHMGFIFLGLASLSLVGVTGAVLVMVAHGLLAALTFGLSGYLYNHTGTLQMEQMGGLLRRVPFIGAALVMAMLAGCGLPGFANFAGEIMALFGAWKDFPLVVVLAAWAALVIGAVYMLRAVRNILHGPLPEALAYVPDANAWRKVPFVLLLAGLLALGIWPRLLTDKIQPDAERLVQLSGGEVDAQTSKPPVLPHWHKAKAKTAEMK